MSFADDQVTAAVVSLLQLSSSTAIPAEYLNHHVIDEPTHGGSQGDGGSMGQKQEAPPAGEIVEETKAFLQKPRPWRQTDLGHYGCTGDNLGTKLQGLLPSCDTRNREEVKKLLSGVRLVVSYASTVAGAKYYLEKRRPKYRPRSDKYLKDGLELSQRLELLLNYMTGEEPFTLSDRETVRKLLHDVTAAINTREGKSRRQC